MENIIIIVISILTILGCNKSKNIDNEQIKDVVNKYFRAIEKNDLKGYTHLIYGSDKFPGGVSSDLFFLNKNYSKINPNNILLRNIKVKDTFSAGVNKKYVMFTLKKPHYKQFETNGDLRLYLMFWKNTGYDKIDQVFIFGNMPEWEDQKPIDLN